MAAEPFVLKEHRYSFYWKDNSLCIAQHAARS